MTCLLTGSISHNRSGIFALFDYSLDDEFDYRTLRRNALVLCLPRKSHDERYKTSFTRGTPLIPSLIFTL